MTSYTCVFSFEVPDTPSLRRLLGVPSKAEERRAAERERVARIAADLRSVG